MIEFIKSIFTTPTNLWTIGQALFALLMYTVALFILIGIMWIISMLVEAIKNAIETKRAKRTERKRSIAKTPEATVAGALRNKDYELLYKQARELGNENKKQKKENELLKKDE